MFEDLEVDSRMGLWAACILLVLVLAGVAGGLWIRQWRMERAAQVAQSEPQSPPAGPVGSSRNPH